MALDVNNTVTYFFYNTNQDGFNIIYADIVRNMKVYYNASLATGYSERSKDVDDEVFSVAEDFMKPSVGCFSNVFNYRYQTIVNLVALYIRNIEKVYI